MPNLLEQGSNWLEEQRRQHCTTPVTYHRGDQSVQVQASIGRTVFKTVSEYGVVERIVSRDFLILASELVIAGQAVLPQRGDFIKELVAGETHVHEVMAPAKEPEWRYSDPYRKTLRIHTKFIGTETAP